jgi:hypothetical protein
MKIEFLRAWEDGLWDTVVMTVPDHVAFGDDDGPVVRWAQQGPGQEIQNRKVVLWAVYSRPAESAPQ